MIPITMRNINSTYKVTYTQNDNSLKSYLFQRVNTNVFKNPIEIRNLVKATFSITIELASRFLNDYITGDQYFRCAYPKHNLVRTRCQLKLAEDIERKWDGSSRI